MSDFPIFDGRTPLTKETMNKLCQRTRANARLTGVGGMTVLDMGSMGKILVPPSADDFSATGTQTAVNGTGFWARLYVSGTATDPDNAPTDLNPGMTARPARPYAYLVEQMLGQAGSLNTADLPSGRRFFVEAFHYGFQHVGSLSTLAAPRSAVVIAFANYTSGTFTMRVISYDSTGIPFGTATTVAIDWPPSVSSLQNAMNLLPIMPGIDEFTVTLISQGPTPQGLDGYAFGIYFEPDSADPASRIDIVLDAALLLPADGTVDVTLTGGATSLVAAPEQTRLLNISPYGVLVFCQPVTDSSGGLHYQFDLPYSGFWGRITGPRVANRTPIVYPFSDAVTIRYVAEQESLAHVPGLLTGYAQEINGETAVGVGTLVWITPVFASGVGFFYFFQAPADVRLLRFLGAGVPNAQVQLRHSLQSPFLAPGNPIAAISEQTATGYAHMVSPSGSQDLFFPGSYYVGTRDGVESGYPKYVAKPELQSEDF